MATWYTDLALAQAQGANFPGAPGQAIIVQPPTWQNNAVCEGPPIITATYQISSGATEAVGDIINICVLPAGTLVDPNGHVATGLTAPAATLTVGVGDNDLGMLSTLPIPNGAAGAAAIGNPATTLQAPAWVSGTTYAPGNVVTDQAASSGIFVSGDTYTCIAATSASTAPHSAATTVWMPNYLRYSGSIDVHLGSANVAFATGTQLYGGPASVLPFSVMPGTAPTGFTATTLLNQPYVIQNDCWLQARVLTVGTLVASTILTFRVPICTAN